MVATVTLVATADLASTPPRMLLSVTASGTPTVSSVTISRTDPDGSINLVRTPDGGPLALSGGAGSTYDYEIPYGEIVTYSIAEGSAPTTTTSMDVDMPWLTHLGDPAKSVALDLRAGSSEDEEWAIDQGVFAILGRENPVVITGGSRQGPASSLLAGTDTYEQRDALRAVLRDGSVLRLNVSPTLGLGIDTAYIAVGNVKAKRRSDVGIDSSRDIELPYQTVTRPAGGTRAGIVWADVDTTYATWAAIPSGKTWAQLAAGA